MGLLFDISEIEFEEEKLRNDCKDELDRIVIKYIGQRCSLRIREAMKKEIFEWLEKNALKR